MGQSNHPFAGPGGGYVSDYDFSQPSAAQQRAEWRRKNAYAERDASGWPHDDDSVTSSRSASAPALSIYDLLRRGQTDLFGSQLEGFEENRDLVEELGVLREEGLASDEQFAEDTAEGREDFLTELDSSRAESEAAATASRQLRKAEELTRQQTQFDDALRANGVDVSTAGSRLEMMGIAPGDFAGDAQSETTAMLHSQNMSSANLLNQMDMVATVSAEFASNANDQASAAAMFGIGEDLSFALQAVDQMRTQGLIDDALALQAISDAERQAGQAYEMAMTNIDVQVLQAAQAAQAAAGRAAESSAAKQRAIQVGAVALGAIQKHKEGLPLTESEWLAISESEYGDEFLDSDLNEPRIDTPTGNLGIDDYDTLAKGYQRAVEQFGANSPEAISALSLLEYQLELPEEAGGGDHGSLPSWADPREWSVDNFKLGADIVGDTVQDWSKSIGRWVGN